MDADLEPVYQEVMEAVHPEDLFGSEDIVLPVQYLLDFLGDKHKKLSAICDPDTYSNPDDSEAAGEAERKLDQLHREATRRIANGTYGYPGFGLPRPGYASKSFDVGTARYYVGSKLAAGSQSTLYQGFLDRDGLNIGEVVLKIARDATDNHFIEREARNLHLLHAVEVPQWKHLPCLLGTFRAGTRVGLVLRKISGFTFTQVHKHPTHAKGVDQRHIVWMLDRLLSCLGYVHNRGIVHGALNPDHVMIVPSTHNAILCGWNTAVHEPAISGETVELADPEFSAPEALDEGDVGPWSDIYSVGKLMIWLMGGNADQEQIPDGVEPQIRNFLLKLVKRDHHKRPADAWELYAEQCAIKDSLWPREFLHFDMS